ncbi:acyl carrier protein [Hymenobacter volaticus]|uniref:Acyl carrier protein n=1 Tax=Hymenobacter volaticus TaxID=2932254 RepID=A0ABY4GFD0_9BACT|nr:acyl carrier protein [Hymenobacter volaticus]UOQ69599.1 acyl carrier protein [Hymenobacter volaticus]
MTVSASSIGRQLLGKRVPQLAAALHLQRDLQLDSLDIVELVICLERQCRIVLPDAEFESWQTVGDVYQSLKRHEAGYLTTCWRCLVDFLS